MHQTADSCTASGTAALRVALHLIAIGVIEARPNGEIWKIARRVPKKNGAVIPITPKRLDYIQGNKYRGVHFRFDGKQYQCPAHQVWWTFHKGPIPAGFEINHKNGVKSDNFPTNLELLTHGENQAHCYKIGLRRVTRKMRAALQLGSLVNAQQAAFRKRKAALGLA